MKKFILLFLVALPSVLYCQQEVNILDEYVNNYRYSEALDYIDGQKPDKDLLLKKAICYRGMNDYKKAFAILNPLSEEYPDDRKIKLELASCCKALSEWDKALKCYEALVKLDSANVYYKIQEADMLFNKNNFEKALVSYKSLTDDYGLTNMINRSAQCYEQINMPDSAIAYYLKAWAADSTDAFSVARLININLKNNGDVSEDENVRKRVSDALDYSQIYMARDSTNKQINLLNALCYYLTDNYDEAILRFEKCYAKGDSTLTLNRSLGICYYYLGQNESAYPFLKKAFEQDSTNINVTYCLASVCNELKDYKSAIGYFERLLVKIFPSPITLYTYYRGLAKAYAGNGDFGLALVNYMQEEKYATKSQKVALYYDMATLYDYDLFGRFWRGY